MIGYITIHRKLLDWEWYNNIPVRLTFIHLLIIANWENKNWQGINIKRGQVVVGRIKLSKKIGISEQQLRTSLNKLKSTNEITIKSTNKCSIITLVNYDDYQIKVLNQPAKKPIDNIQSTTTKEYNNIYRQFAHLKITVGDLEKLKETYSLESINNTLDKIENYAKNKNYKSLYLTCLNWLKKESQSKPIKKIKANKNPYFNEDGELR